MTTEADRYDDEVDTYVDDEGRIGASRSYAVMLLITGALGLLAAWVIMQDKMHLLEDPNFTPGCSLNPVISCANVMKSDQAAAFGFPNPFAGLIGFGVIITVGMALLAGARFKAWFWLTMNAFMLVAAVFCMWLMTQAFYDIHAVCLWCCLVWCVTVVMFSYTTIHNIRTGRLPAPGVVKGFLLEFPWVVPVIWIGVLAILCFTEFGTSLFA